MERSWKVFFNTLLCIAVFFLSLDGPINSEIIKPSISEITTSHDKFHDMNKNDNSYSNIYKTDYKIKYLENQNKNNERVNFLILGVEGGLRTDTIIFTSFNPKTKKVNMISIPRDTYFYEEGYKRGDQRKINAAYGRNKEKGSVKAIEKILGVPIHHFVSVDFEGVEEIVDIIGGVEINVPCDMAVCGIRISKGTQILNGNQAIKFVRFRKKYPDGDLGRIKIQQQFIKSAMKKTFSLNLPKVIKKSFEYVKTDMTVKDILYYSFRAKNIKADDISMRTLPGVPRYKDVGGKSWSYYFYDQKQVKELVDTLINKVSSDEIRTEKLVTK